MPPKPPLKPPLHEAPPKSPHPPPHKPPHEPPHERRKKFLGKRVIYSVGIGLIVTFVLSLVLWIFNIPINVILPVAAPVWAGTTTIAYTALGDKFE
ncbi:MAG: hypothetical protein ABIE23_04015 [archaeon]